MWWLPRVHAGSRGSLRTRIRLGADTTTEPAVSLVSHDRNVADATSDRPSADDRVRDGALSSVGPGCPSSLSAPSAALMEAIARAPAVRREPGSRVLVYPVLDCHFHPRPRTRSPGRSAPAAGTARWRSDSPCDRRIVGLDPVRRAIRTMFDRRGRRHGTASREPAWSAVSQAPRIRYRDSASSTSVSALLPAARKAATVLGSVSRGEGQLMINEKYTQRSSNSIPLGAQISCELPTRRRVAMARRKRRPRRRRTPRLATVAPKPWPTSNEQQS